MARIMSCPVTADYVPLGIVPATIADARRYVGEHHRHNLPPQGGLWAAALRDLSTGQIRGVGLAGRPVARALDDGLSVEITRVCTDGVPNGCSMLYGALWRAGQALGYRRAYTYTLADESGSSLRASGWAVDAELPPRGGWDTGRHRVEVDLFGTERTPTGPKIRWVKKAA